MSDIDYMSQKEYIDHLSQELKNEYPEVALQGHLVCTVNEVLENGYFISFKDDNEDYVMEIEKQHFPPGEIVSGTIFYLFYGEDKSAEEFSKIKLETRRWTPEAIETAQKKAQEMCQSFNISLKR